MTKALAWCQERPLYTLMMAPCVGVLVADAVELVLVLCGYWQ